MKKLMTLSVCSGFFFIGMTITIFGTTNIYLQGHFGTTISRIGLLITFMSFGRVSAVLFTWMRAGKIKGKALFQAGAFLIASGMILVGLVSEYIFAVFFFYAMGIGHGLVDVSGSILTAAVHPERFGGAMNNAHMYVGIGSLVGPLSAGTILTISGNWQQVYFFQGAFGVILFLMISLLHYPEAKMVKQDPKCLPKGTRLISFVFILLCAIILLYSGAGHSLNSWIGKYVIDTISVPAFFAAGTLAVYNVGLTLGRFICSIYIEKAGYGKVLKLGALGSLISIIGVLFFSSATIILISLFSTGLFFGGLFPTTITAARSIYPQKLTAMTSILILAASFGVMTVPALIGFISEYTSMSMGLKLITIPVAIMTAATFAVKAPKNKSGIDQCT